MKVALLALTGFGNEVLKALLEHRAVDDVSVYTRSERGRFPYYDCDDLTELCARQGVSVRIDLDLRGLRRDLEMERPDMIVVATFNRRLSKEILDLPPRGTVNIHPSLLPHYRGPTPTHWALIRGEKESGVTFHRMGEAYDMGDILYQQKIPITGLTDGELRQALAGLSSKMLHAFIPMYLNGECRARPQREEDGSYYPRITSEEGIALLKSGAFNRDNLLRGMSPYPGMNILA